MRLLVWTLAALLVAVGVRAQPDGAPTSETVHIRPKSEHKPTARVEAPAVNEESSLLAPDVDVVDAPTAAALDYGGYSARSRFFSQGGILQYLSFGVFQGVNIGASFLIDGLIGTVKDVHARAPNAQVKWRFYDGDRALPALALGYDGQGYDYDQINKLYNQRQRGFYLVGSQELGLAGLFAHPSVNISDFDSNAVYGSVSIAYNIKDRVALLTEWDNIRNITDSRANAGLRVYITPALHVDFDVRSIGQSGKYSNGDSRGPERIVQLKYTGNF